MADLIVAFSRIEDARNIRAVLNRHGRNVVSVCRSGAYVLNAADRLGSGIILCGYKLTDMLGTELAETVSPAFRMILITSPDRADAALSVLGTDIRQRITPEPLPIHVQHLLDTIDGVEREMVERHRHRRPRARSAAEQENIDAAKCLLMEMRGMSENMAHRYLQQKSMESGDSFGVTAEKMLVLLQQEKENGK